MQTLPLIQKYIQKYDREIIFNRSSTQNKNNLKNIIKKQKKITK